MSNLAIPPYQNAFRTKGVRAPYFMYKGDEAWLPVSLAKSREQALGNIRHNLALHANGYISRPILRSRLLMQRQRLDAIDRGLDEIKLRQVRVLR